MNIKIEIISDAYPMPENPSIENILKARIKEQVAILNALEAEKTKAIEKKEMLESITREATRPRSTGL